MKKVNLRDLYPDVYKSDHFVEVTEDVLETLRAAERAEAAYDRRMYRYKAHYSLDCDNGIENAILMKPQTPEMLLEEKQLREQLYAAVMALPEKQAKRIYARYYLGMRVSEITAEIRALIDKAAAGVELAGDEYIDLSDGLIHCKKCGGQRQTVVPCFGKSGYFMPRCICQCQQEAEEQRKAAEERQRRMERIKRRKAQGLQDRYLYDYTFANDNGQNPLMDKARDYVENWKEAYKSNIGLLLFGDVGTGKSFFAGCIANALLDQDVPVLMTNFPTILNRLTGMFSEDRSEFIASFDEYDLLIIDDLGVERSTEYAMEQMFFVIDSRYRSRRPMIITTNLKLSELKNPPDLAHARIYDRILERCAPILFDGKNFREENAGATRQTAKDIVSSKQD